MKYKITLNQDFYAWQPSTWPAPPSSYNAAFGNTLRTIFYDSLLGEIDNVITDAPTLEYRGHVVALSILCAVDAVSSYAFRNSQKDICESCKRTDKVGPRYKRYIREFFPNEYQPFAAKLYSLFRNSITHSWNLFEAAMLPGNEPITEVNGTIVLGLGHFFTAFKSSVDTFLDRLQVDNTLQAASLHRYRELKHMARP
ncbi:MAG: hypothetical protein ABSB95_03625 [Dissulfurispiraceae bacterium]|jgi:hypothetical protein